MTYDPCPYHDLPLAERPCAPSVDARVKATSASVGRLEQLAVRDSKRRVNSFVAFLLVVLAGFAVAQYTIISHQDAAHAARSVQNAEILRLIANDASVLSALNQRGAENHQILSDVAANGDIADTALGHGILCIDNSLDRATASIVHAPIPALVTGCPPDGLGTVAGHP